MLGVVQGSTQNSSRMRAFPATVKCLLRCNTTRTIIERFSEDADILADLLPIKSSRRRLTLKGHWNVRGVLLGACFVLTTNASCRGHRVGESG